MAHLNIALFGPTKNSLTDVDPPFLKLRSDRGFSEGPQVITVTMGDECFEVEVLPVRPAEGGQVWVRLVDSSHISADQLALKFRQHLLTRSALERRRNERIKARLRVKSPDLPGETGTTYDISRHGMRIVTEGPLPIGAILDLVVEDVKVRGEVVWSIQNRTEPDQVGIRLINAN